MLGGIACVQLMFDVLHAKGGTRCMNHGVTIRTNRSEISNRVDDVLGANIRKRNNMVNMNESRAYCAICRFEIKTTGQAPASVVGDTEPASFGVSFVGIDSNSH